MDPGDIWIQQDFALSYFLTPSLIFILASYIAKAKTHFVPEVVLIRHHNV
jgi:hypothetical protein